MTTNYTSAIIFTKHTDMMPWFESKYSRMSDEHIQLKKHCSEPRDVQLILLVRYERGHIYCKIKCPINPLFTKGEFEAVSLKAVVKHLEREGWTVKVDLPISLLK